jgi:carboxyl-terminal processing protease
MCSSQYLSLFLSLLFVLSPLSSFAVTLLEKADVQKVMSQVLEQHLGQKKLTNEVLQSSYGIYLDQFDNNKIYLLESEVVKSLNTLRAKKIVINKVDGEFSDFNNYNFLDQQIAETILRARKIRQELRASILEQVPSLNPYQSSHGIFGDMSYAHSEEELKQRSRVAMIEFLNKQAAIFGIKSVGKEVNKHLTAYENQLREKENSYLYVNLANQKMPAKMEENVFVMHILKALTKSLDSHTQFFDEKEALDMRTRLEKGFYGIGVGLKNTSQGILIGEVFEGGAAHKSGKVAIQDKIIEVNGKRVETSSVDDLLKMLRGEKGESVSLLLKRGDALNKVNLNRELVAINEGRAELTYEKFGNGVIAKIKLDTFYKGEGGISAEKDVRQALKLAKEQGDVQGLILDLRENGGGFLTEAVKVAGLFVSNGVIVVSKYSQGDKKIYRDIDGKVLFDGPLIVLTSKATASAAEIVAQALQDWGVAVIVGDEKTYGKGTIQSQTVTEAGSPAYFKVTVGKYYTVSGKTPQIKGVKADVVVPGYYSMLDIGEEYIADTGLEDSINPAYSDSLQDVARELKPWYLRYYTPTEQKQKTFWKAYMPLLQENSKNRLARNKDFQLFFEHLNNKESSPFDFDFGAEDIQMDEATSVLKDMISLSKQKNRPTSNIVAQ